MILFIDKEGNAKGAASMSHQEIYEIMVKLNEFELSSRQILSSKKCQKGKYQSGDGVNGYEIEKVATERIKGSIVYECKCKVCGKISKLNATQIRHGKKCACQKTGKYQTGDVVNDYEIEEVTAKRVRESIVYKCKCVECGKKTELSVRQIWYSKKCACQKGEYQSGDVVNGYEIEKVATERIRGRIVYECKCKVCGEISKLNSTQIRYGKKCACQKTGKYQTGDVVNGYEIEKVMTEKGKNALTVYKCKCKVCGKISKLNSAQIRHAKRCECQKTRKYQSGDVVNGYEIEKVITERIKSSNVYECKCKVCGEISKLNSTQIWHGKKCACQNSRIGKSINGYRLIKPTNEKLNGFVVWECEHIECGKSKKLSTKQICGSIKCDCQERSKFVFKTGEVINGNELIERTDERRNNCVIWKCKCVKCKKVRLLSTRQIRNSVKCECEYNSVTV